MTAQSSLLAGDVMEEWSSELPKEPGDYIFYGRFGRPGNQTSIRWEICHAGATRTGDLIYAAGGVFLYPGEFTGKFKALRVEAPSLEGL